MIDKNHTMCVEEAIARMHVLKDRTSSPSKYLELHSMVTTLIILRGLGFKRVALEVY
jgi:hypothetical protein